MLGFLFLGLPEVHAGSSTALKIFNWCRGAAGLRGKGVADVAHIVGCSLRTRRC